MKVATVMLVIGVLFATAVPAGARTTIIKYSGTLTINASDGTALKDDGKGPYSGFLQDDSSDFLMMSLPTTGRTFSLHIPGLDTDPTQFETCQYPRGGSFQNTIIVDFGSWLTAPLPVSTVEMGQIKCTVNGVQYELQYFNAPSGDWCTTVQSVDGRTWNFAAPPDCLATVRKGSNRTFVARGSAPFSVTFVKNP